MAKLLEKRQAEIEAEVDLTFFLLVVNNTALNGILFLTFIVLFFLFILKEKGRMYKFT